MSVKSVKSIGSVKLSDLKVSTLSIGGSPVSGKVWEVCREGAHRWETHLWMPSFRSMFRYGLIRVGCPASLMGLGCAIMLEPLLGAAACHNILFIAFLIGLSALVFGFLFPPSEPLQVRRCAICGLSEKGGLVPYSSLPGTGPKPQWNRCSISEFETVKAKALPQEEAQAAKQRREQEAEQRKEEAFEKERLAWLTHHIFKDFICLVGSTAEKGQGEGERKDET